MKRIFIAILLLISVVFCSPCFAAVGFYGATSLTGSGTGALDAIDGTNLADGAAAYVVTATGFYVYHLNASSGAAESSPDVISPDSNAGNKRWILVARGTIPTAAIAGLAVTDGNVIVGNGSTWIAESGDTARISLGVGSTDSPTFVTTDLTTITDNNIPKMGASGFADSAITDDGAGTVAVQSGTDALTGFQVLDADGGTPVLNVDTVNERTGFGTATPATTVDVNGTVTATGGNFTGDIDQNGNRLIQSQSIADLTAGKAGASSYWFDGVDDYVSLGTFSGTNLDVGTGDFSYVTTLKSRTATTSPVFSAYVDLANRTYIRLIDGQQPLIFAKVADTAVYFYQTQDVTVVPLDTWLTLGVVGDRDDTVYVYINGKSQTLTENFTITSVDLNTNATAYLGRYDIVGSEYGDLEIASFKQFNLALDNSDPVDQAIINGGEVPFRYNGDGGSPASQTEATSGTLVIGKAYRINDWITNDDFTNVGGTNEDGNEFVATGTTPTTWTNASTVVRIGCVADYNPSGIGHKQWVDNSGNKLMGEVSGAIPTNLSTTHREKYIKTAVTADTTYTSLIPAGYILTRVIFEETAGNTGTLSLGTSDGATDIMADQTITASSITTVKLNKMFSTSVAQTVDLNDDGSGTWNSASVNVTFEMERADIN